MMVHNNYYYIWKYVLLSLLAIIIPIVFLIFLKIFQKVTIGKCKSLVCLKGKTAIITGGSTGIGYETALDLASRGCRVIIADKQDATQAKQKIIERTNNTEVITKYLDFTSLQSVRKFAKDINTTEERLDILINNAGVGTVGNKHTDDGLHATMQINHFGPFLLTHLLTDLLKKSAPSRIIFVSSAMAFCSNLTVENLNYPKNHPLSLFRTSLIYSNSKLCNIISAIGFADRLKDSGVTANALHPGLVNTDIYFKMNQIIGLQTLTTFLTNSILFIYGKTPKEGAQTIIQLAVSNKLKDVSGKYFWDCRLFPFPPGAWSKAFCEAIWLESEKLVNLKSEERLI